MGNQASDGKGSADEHTQLMQNYNTIKTIQDEKYGEGVLMQNKITGEYCILKEYNSTDDQEFDKTYAKYKKRQELSHENIIMILGLAQKKESQLCSTFYKVYVLYEYTNDNFEKHIQLRTQTRKNFTEGELWDILGQTVSGLNYLQQKGITHQNVKASNIFFDQNSRIKVADSQVIQQLNMFSQVATNTKEPPKNSYLSPALIEALRQNNWSPNHDTGKSDVFSLGMTILSAGLLEDLDCCYSYNPEPTFLEDVFKQRFNQFKSIYSSKLTNFVGIMTSTHEDTRPDFSLLWSQLQQFSYNDNHSSNYQVGSERSHFGEIVVNQGQEGHTRLKSLHANDEQQNHFGGDPAIANLKKKQSPTTQPKIINDDNENVIDDTEDIIDQIKRSNPQNYNKNYAEKQSHSQLNQAESRQPAVPQKQISQIGTQNSVNPLKNSNFNQSQTTTIQNTAIPRQNSTHTLTNYQNNSNNSYSNLAPKAAAPSSGGSRYSIPMNKDSQSLQSTLINPPKTNYNCKTQVDENTGAIERGTTRQGEVESYLQSQQQNQISNSNNKLQQGTNNGKLSSRSNSFHNNNTNNFNGNIRSGSSANLHANNTSQGNIQQGSVQKQNSFHNSNTSMTKDHNFQNLNDISNIHNYSNIDDFKISNQQSNIFNNNHKLQHLTTTTPYKPQNQNSFDNKQTKLDDFKNIKVIPQSNNNLDNNYNSGNNYIIGQSTTYAQNNNHNNSNNLSTYLPSTQYQAKSIGLNSNNTSYNNIASYSKPLDYNFPSTTQQFGYSQNDGKSLMTNFDDLKLKLQEAELKAKQEYESKHGKSISNTTSSYSTVVQPNANDYSAPYSNNILKVNSEVDEIMKKYENKNNTSAYGNQPANSNYGDLSNRRNSQYKQANEVTNQNYNPSPISNNYSNQMQNESEEEEIKKNKKDDYSNQNNYQPKNGQRNITPISSVNTNTIPQYTPVQNVSNTQRFQNEQNQTQQNYQQLSPQLTFQQQQTSQQSYQPYQSTQQQSQYTPNDNLPSFNYQQQYNSEYNNNNNNNNNQFYSNRFSNEIPEVVIENYPNGSRYEGEKLNGMRHGQGRFYYQDGGLYDGEWRDNKMNGRGVLSYGSGKIAYDGNWEDDKFHGFGALYNENPAELLECYDYRDFDQVDEFWIKYDGEFKDDNKDGFGTLYLSNGERFEGSFKNDFVCGPGSFYKINGEKIDGIWQNNNLIQS